jgi:predicted outer membrane repeat protein
LKIRFRLLTTLALTLLVRGIAGATTFTVSNTSDAGTGSLRAAITAANADNTATDTSPHIITATGISGTISLQSSLPLLIRPISINGPGASSLTITRGVAGTFRIFAVNDFVPVTITGISITNGSSNKGGGIFNEGVLTLINTTLSGNTASDDGGAIYSSFGTVTLTGATVSNNTASQSGGGIYNEGGPMVIGTSIFSGNTASGGGAISSHTTATTTIINTTFSDNTASAGGGAISNFDTPMTLTNVTLSGNTGRDGGAIYNNNDESELKLIHCTLTDNTASGSTAFGGSGGGIYVASGTLTMDTTIISDNAAAGNTSTGGSGGGIYFADEDHPMTLTGSTVSDNRASEDGGGIYNVDKRNGMLTLAYSTVSGNRAADDGGGIYNESSIMTITASTISGNRASGDGGGIEAVNAAFLLITNSTISGNTASGDGGGIASASADMVIASSTISGQQAARGGGIYSVGNVKLHLHNTIIAANSATVSSPDVLGSMLSDGHNLVGNTAGSSGWVASDLQNIDPELGPLQNNGGPTETMALPCGSPAIDAGDNTDAPATDQRGGTRIVDADCDGIATIDIGAYELVNIPPTIILTSSAIELSSPNHNYQTINVTDFVTGITNPTGSCTTLSVSDVVITRVTSDESEDANGGGDGNTLDDIVIASNCKSVKLRAERDGSGNGRVYRIYVSGHCAQNTSFKVSVRKGSGAAVEGSVAYSETSSCSSAPKQVVQIPQMQYGFSLIENYPNPFNGSTTIGYSIAVTGFVHLTVFDMSGRVVTTLVDEVQDAGEYRILFRKSGLPDGTYYYVLESNGERLTGSMMIVQ